jgi:hypothetical protein
MKIIQRSVLSPILAASWLLAAGAMAQTPPSPLSQPPVGSSVGVGEPSISGLAPAAVLRQTLPPLPADAPKPDPDPRDLEGTWLHDQPLVALTTTDMYGNPAPLNDRGKQLLARRLKALQSGTPYINASSLCLPTGINWPEELNSPFHIFQSKHRVDVLFQEDRDLWSIAMNPAQNPAPAPAAADRPYDGTSIGHWDGNTLVVDITGMKQPLWMDVDGTPASVNAHITQRIRKLHQGYWFLEIVTTLDDPTYYTRPWSWVRTFAWRPDREVFAEYDCEEQSGGVTDAEAFGLVPEPPEDQR